MDKNSIPLLAVYQTKNTTYNYKILKRDNKEEIPVAINFSNGIIKNLFYNKNKTIQNLIEDISSCIKEPIGYLLTNSTITKSNQKLF